MHDAGQEDLKQRLVQSSVVFPVLSATIHFSFYIYFYAVMVEKVRTVRRVCFLYVLQCADILVTSYG